jgi:AbiJ-like protein
MAKGIVGSNSIPRKGICCRIPVGENGGHSQFVGGSMVSFSERIGITLPKSIQLDSLDDDLRNSLWNVCYEYCFTRTGASTPFLLNDEMYQLAVALQRDFYKQPIQMLSRYTLDYVQEQLRFFHVRNWYEVLNLIQFLHNEFSGIHQQNFEADINHVLEREKSAYRFIAGELAPITSQVEMTEVERAMQYGARFEAVSEHVRAALALYSSKPSPDYRNSIKESISAVEASARIISGDSSAKLGDALKIIDDAKPIHGALKQALLKLYGYTSDEGGIRHSLVEAPNIDESDARFMLVACSAFVNYLISRS